MPVLIEGAGVPLAVTEQGEGPPLLLVHDLASDAEDLAPLAAALSGRARVISYDRRGYGASGAPVPYEATTVHEQAQDAAAVLEELSGAPALVCGIGFGALVALDLMDRHGGLVRGAVLCDPPLFAFVAEAAEALAAERELLEGGLREGGPALAVARWLGPQAGAARVARAQEHARAFFADMAGLPSWPVTRGQLRALEVPASVVTSPGAAPHVIAAADAVAALLPGTHRSADGDVAAAARALAV
jgi:pimeloyl-ACP methyl ester carboxylesterase